MRGEVSLFCMLFAQQMKFEKDDRSLTNFLVLNIKTWRICEHRSCPKPGDPQHHRCCNTGLGMNLQKPEVFPQNCPHDCAARTHSYKMDVAQGQMVKVLGCDNPCVCVCVWERLDSGRMYWGWALTMESCAVYVSVLWLIPYCYACVWETERMHTVFAWTRFR